MTFSGTAADDEGLKNVEVTLRNSSTGENLGNDGTWGTGVSAGVYRVSPVNISGTTYDWSYTTPFDLSPGSYSFTVRATDDLDLTTSSSNQGSLTISAQFAGDLAPNTTMSFTAPTDKSLTVNLAGTATDDVGRRECASLPSGQGHRALPAGQRHHGCRNRLPQRHPRHHPRDERDVVTATHHPADPGELAFRALAFDTRGQQDPSAATATYQVYPNDGPPSLSETLGQPQTGATFSDGRIVVTGRAEDAPDANASIAAVQVAVVNSLGQYMSSSGAFTSTTASYRTAFLNSPGSAASNYSFTTPVIPSGTYTVIVRPVDLHDQIGEARTSTGIVVTAPDNLAPVASATVSCVQNVCSFDGRGSTDENPTSLTYTWNFGGSSSGTSGAIPTRTYTAPGTFTPTLTVRDEWNVTSEVVHLAAHHDCRADRQPGTDGRRSSRTAVGLTCSVSSAGTADPNGDSISYSWNFGDGTDEQLDQPQPYLRRSGDVHDHGDDDRRLGAGPPLPPAM